MGILLDRRGRELSRMETLGALSLILIVVYLLLERAEGVMASVEAASLNVAVTRLRTNVQMESVLRMMKGGQSRLAELEGANPMVLGSGSTKSLGVDVSSGSEAFVLDSARYLGELDSPDPASIPGGKWYFDSRTRVLVYRVDRADYFETPLAGPKRARFRVQIDYEDSNGNKRFDAGEDRLRNATLESLDDYWWRK